jgi:hypothetical protein
MSAILQALLPFVVVPLSSQLALILLSYLCICVASRLGTFEIVERFGF